MNVPHSIVPSSIIYCMMVAPLSLNGQCTTVFDIASDTTICPGVTWNLDAGDGFLFYEWENGSTERYRGIRTEGPVRCEVVQEVPGSDRVLNGDLSEGEIGFTTSYLHGATNLFGPLSLSGTYLVAPSPLEAHILWLNCGDHTSGDGNMFMVNGSLHNEDRVWCQTIEADPYTDYVFSAWLMTPSSGPRAHLGFLINDSLVGRLHVPAASCRWQRFNARFTTDSVTVLQLCIANDNVSQSGNDFALDDITFTKTCTYADSFMVEVNDIIQVEGTDVFLFCDCPIFIPTAFTPNGDDYNDLWGPRQDCPGITHELYVFDAWGTVVHHAEGAMVDWDGTHSKRETPARPGIYRYEIHTTSGPGGLVDKLIRGHVTLIR